MPTYQITLQLKADNLADAVGRIIYPDDTGSKDLVAIIEASQIG